MGAAQPAQPLATMVRRCALSSTRTSCPLAGSRPSATASSPSPSRSWCWSSPSPKRRPRTWLQRILEQWPAYLAYVTSFMTLGVMWLRHTGVTSMLRAGDSLLFRINLLVLLLAAFLPFPTKLIGEFIGDYEPERIAVLFYGIVLLLLDLAMVAFARYGIEGRRLVKDGVPDARLRAAVAPVSLAFYVVAIAVGYLLPTIGVTLYLAIALYLGVPARTIHRLLRWRGSDTEM